MEKKTFGFGIVGAGVISNFHAQAIAAVDNASLIGAYDFNQNTLDIFSKTNNCIAYDTLEDMLVNPEIEVVCICTPSGLHLEPALKCIEAGKNCLIEKPLEVTVEKCDKIINASQKAGVKIGVIFPSRFYKLNQQLKESISSNKFGDLVLGDAYVKWSRSADYYKSGKWRGTWQFDGGGALMNQGIHSVDLLQWFMGPVKSVQAYSANVLHQEIEVEDTVIAILKFANGALGTIECSTAVFPGSFKRIEILGTLGTSVIEENDLLKWNFKNEMPEDELIRKKFAGGNTTGGGASDPTAISYYGHQLQIENMIHAIEDDINPFIDAREGRKSVEIIMAIYESARSGKEVALNI